LEELGFLHDVYLAALYASRCVKFVAVLDNNGKLILAEYRKGVQNYWRTDFVSDNGADRHDSGYLFYMDYLLPAIKKVKSCSVESTKKHQSQDEVHFEILEINNNNIRLVVAPLNERKDKYLCIYIESSVSDQEIISKLRNAII
jgi:hypothetical protein